MNVKLIFWSMTVTFCVYSAYVWTAGTSAPQSLEASEQVRRGHTLYQENNCTACHQIYGLGGYMGPDLTNVISQKGDVYAAAFIQAGTARMPAFGFDKEETEDLLAFLAFVDSMGTYGTFGTPGFEMQWNGWVAQNPDKGNNTSGGSR